ncbi:hypothetical protein [Thalassoglobus neptunius]|nr:hypothetical protein [Thalassoglobus neptunius]
MQDFQKTIAFIITMGNPINAKIEASTIATDGCINNVFFYD